MLNDIINEIKNKFNTTVPIDNVIQYVITAFNFGKLENSESFKFRRFNNECIDRFSDFKYIPNPYNGGDDDFIIADMVRKEYTYGEYGSELFSDIHALNRDYKNYTIKDLINEELNI